MKRVYQIIICLLILFDLSQCGLFSWMFKSYEKGSASNVVGDGDASSVKDSALDTTAHIVNVPFEMTTADEKFISEVTSLTSVELSQLDACHHRVILGLKSTCSDMSEEELAKVAVNLLNCQSFVEGRAVYPCTNEMSIQECTKPMDLSTWNAYHIVSNRARAVCYQFRQQQFKAKTELTINKLMVSARDQIDAMKQIEDSQTKLKDTTFQTFTNLNYGHQMLIEQQEQLSASQHSIHNYVAANLRELSKEKKLIALGQKELTHITGSIKKKLMEAHKQLQEQGTNQQDSHEKILLDLASIQESAQKVGKQLDESTIKILETHKQTVAFYNQLMTDLDQMNSTVYHLMNLLKNMRAKFEERFTWISALLGDTDENLKKISSFALHTCYFFLSMVGAGFLKVPYVTRVFLVILVPLNAFFELKYSSCMPFSTLTIVLLTSLCVNLSSKSVKRFFKRRQVRTIKSSDPSQNPKDNHSIVQAHHTTLNSNEYANSSSKSRQCFEDRFSKISNQVSAFEQKQQSLLREINRDSTCDSEPRLKEGTPIDSTNELKAVRQRLFTAQYPKNSETDSFSSLLKNRDTNIVETPLKSPIHSDKCSAICKSGLPCKNTPSTRSRLCSKHQRNLSRGSPAL